MPETSGVRSTERKALPLFVHLHRTVTSKLGWRCRRKDARTISLFLQLFYAVAESCGAFKLKGFGGGEHL